MADKPQSSYDEIVAGLAAALGDFEPFHNYVLVGVHIQPETRKSGLIITQTTRDEDKWQGKVGVVLKKGAMAFKDDGIADFGGLDVELGDWVLYRVTDGYSLDLNGIRCRLLQDTELRGRIKDPTTIY